MRIDIVWRSFELTPDAPKKPTLPGPGGADANTFDAPAGKNVASAETMRVVWAQIGL